MSSQWYTKRGNEAKLGPFSDKELKQRAMSGELLPTDLIWRQGMAKPALAEKARGLFPDPSPFDSSQTNPDFGAILAEAAQSSEAAPSNYAPNRAEPKAGVIGWLQNVLHLYSPSDPRATANLPSWAESKLVRYTMWVFSLFLVILGISLFCYQVSFHAAAERTTGKIIQILEEEGTGRRGRATLVYRPVIESESKFGGRQTFKSGLSVSSPDTYKIGDSVDILYTQSDAQIPSFVPWMTALCCFLFGAAVMYGLVFIHLALAAEKKRKARKN
ncbi:MAG: DUF4339 domain-containing protein [Planctomycetaceae bacterium]|jgi:hypothetical protein|nr:DUF4339 domain-containing protein [Planctomycetaceae bacterium]